MIRFLKKYPKNPEKKPEDSYTGEWVSVGKKNRKAK